MTRWLVVGAGGMLVRDLVAALAGDGEDGVGLTRRDLDLTDEAAVRTTLGDVRPDVVVGGKGVAEALGDKDRAAGGVVEPHRPPAPEAGRAYPKVDDHVDDRPAGARDVLRLARRDIGEGMPRMTPRRDTEQLAWARSMRYPTSSWNSASRNPIRGSSRARPGEFAG
jgi:hypothetical protein